MLCTSQRCTAHRSLWVDVREIAEHDGCIHQVAEEVNTLVDNIGARRLYTILERILEDISFSAPEQVCCSWEPPTSWQHVGSIQGRL